MTFAAAYIGLWGAACLAAAILYLRHPKAFAISSRAYWRFLLAPWKVATFVAAASGLTLIAPLARDPTWDYVDALFMSVLTFATAPWAVGVLYRWTSGGMTLTQAFVAACVSLFSASWSYDLYLLFRDGRYPVTWWANLLASSVLYLCAGLFWSLDWVQAHGLHFAFAAANWPAPPAGPGAFRRIAGAAALVMAVVGLTILFFLWQQWRR